MASETNSPFDVSLLCVSYNIHGFKSNWHYLKSLLNNNDIVFVQEHWLPSCDLQCLHSLHSDFFVYARSSMDDKYEHGLRRGRPFGGVAAFVRKCYKKSSKKSQRVSVVETFKYLGVKFVAKNCLYVDVPSIKRKILCCLQWCT